MAKKTPKSEASKAMSRYVRLRDALAYCKRIGIDLGQFIRPEDIIGCCCTCGAVKSWIRMDAGHYKGRGIGGSSGVYFDKRNVNLQCKRCNKWGAGMPGEYREYLIELYDEPTVEDIELRHRMPRPAIPYEAIELMYREMYNKLVAEL